MAQKKKTATSAPAKAGAPSSRRPTKRKENSSNRLIFALVLLVLAFFAFLGYFDNDGVFIKFLRGLMLGLLGGGFYLLAPVLFACAAAIGFRKEKTSAYKIICTLLLPVVAGAFCQLFSRSSYELSFSMFRGLWNDGKALSGGGALGGSVTVLFVYLFSQAGAAIFLVCVGVGLLVAIFSASLKSMIEKMREREESRYDYEEEELPEKKEKAAPQPAHIPPQRRNRKAIDIPMDEPVYADNEPLLRPKKQSFFNSRPNKVSPDELLTGDANNNAQQDGKEPVIEIQTQPEVKMQAHDVVTDPIPAVVAEVSVMKQVEEKPSKQKPDTASDFERLIEDSARRDLAEAMQTYKFPPLSLLSAPQTSKIDGKNELAATKERLEMTLQSFGINANISNIIHGPAVTRYEMELEVGVKLNKLTNLADDIALSLGVSGVRIAAIPNKISTVGIEVPNKNVSTVYLREVIDSREFRDAKSRLTFAIGKNISGDVMLGNISKLPHLLVAGTTGSGKSVCLNSLILSLMYKSTPEQIKFIMIDPKMVEFKIYNGIPHLLVPVVTEAKKAAGALQWAVVEMMKRYRTFSDSGARDLASYNDIAVKNGETAMPQIVIIIDELADLMMIAAKEVEESICRIAQMGRAAGVHLVIATQSPRADVITGLMKANIPSRIAFKVASSLESRIILDAGGAADKLVGNGDMLFAPIGTSKPLRIQGTWVSDDEREKIVEFVKANGQAEYSEEVMSEIERAAEEKDGNGKVASSEEKNKDYDDLLPQAADVIFETGQASVSMLQRRLKLGYSRAARLIDQLEEIGIVGPFEGSKPRQILITRAQWQEMQYMNGTAPIEKPVEGESELGSNAMQTMFTEEDLF